MRSVVTVAILLALVVISSLVAAIPQIVSYQGRLTTPSGNPVANGDYLIKFAIYDVPTGGIPIWSCDYQTISLADGLFDVMLGAAPMPPLPIHLFSSDTSRYLEIKVGTDPEIIPRTEFTSVAYAYQAVRADIASSAETASMVRATPNQCQASAQYLDWEQID